MLSGDRSGRPCDRISHVPAPCRRGRRTRSMEWTPAASFNYRVGLRPSDRSPAPATGGGIVGDPDLLRTLARGKVALPSMTRTIARIVDVVSGRLNLRPVNQIGPMPTAFQVRCEEPIATLEAHKCGIGYFPLALLQPLATIRTIDRSGIRLEPAREARVTATGRMRSSAPRSRSASSGPPRPTLKAADRRSAKAVSRRTRDFHVSAGR